MSNSQKVVSIVGAGEIGTSMANVLSPYFSVELFDKFNEKVNYHTDLLIIAFPYSEEFVSEVRRYQDLFLPNQTLIISTVSPGTSRMLGATHSHVTGMHPFMEASIKTFIRFISGPQASEVAHYFRRAGIKVHLFDKQEVTELGKISQTTIYALLIEYVKDLKKRCDDLDLAFTEVFTELSRDYNEGYAKLGHPEYMIPLLQPIMTKQGGHCTINNCELWTTPFTDLIKEMNGKYGRE